MTDARSLLTVGAHGRRWPSEGVAAREDNAEGERKPLSSDLVGYWSVGSVQTGSEGPIRHRDGRNQGTARIGVKIHGKTGIANLGE